MNNVATNQRNQGLVPVQGNYSAEYCQRLYGIKSAPYRRRSDAHLLQTLQKYTPIFSRSQDGSYGFEFSLSASKQRRLQRNTLTWESIYARKISKYEGLLALCARKNLLPTKTLDHYFFLDNINFFTRTVDHVKCITTGPLQIFPQPTLSKRAIHIAHELLKYLTIKNPLMPSLTQIWGFELILVGLLNTSNGNYLLIFLNSLPGGSYFTNTIQIFCGLDYIAFVLNLLSRFISSQDPYGPRSINQTSELIHNALQIAAKTALLVALMYFGMPIELVSRRILTSSDSYLKNIPVGLYISCIFFVYNFFFEQLITNFITKTYTRSRLDKTLTRIQRDINAQH